MVLNWGSWNEKIGDYLSELISDNPPLIRLAKNQVDQQTDVVLGNLYDFISNEVIGDQELENILLKKNFFKKHRRSSKYL